MLCCPVSRCSLHCLSQVKHRVYLVLTWSCLWQNPRYIKQWILVTEQKSIKHLYLLVPGPECCSVRFLLWLWICNYLNLQVHKLWVINFGKKRKYPFLQSQHLRCVWREAFQVLPCSLVGSSRKCSSFSTFVCLSLSSCSSMGNTLGFPGRTDGSLRVGAGTVA